MLSPAAFRQAFEAELQDNLLPFWRQRTVDKESSGFIGAMDNDGAIRADAPKGLILNSRILWAFAAVYGRFGDPRDRELAQRAYSYLLEHFADREYGGFLWLLDPEGRPLDSTKKIYGQAFCIYALSEYHLATEEQKSLEQAKQVFRLIEDHAHDPEHGGYLETLTADWSAAEDLRLSDKDMNSPKSMNNHLHVLEAYTNLYRVWPDPAVATRLQEMMGEFEQHVVERSSGGCHLQHFFDRDWVVRSQTYTYGHAIEAGWLLCEAADVLGDDQRQIAMRRLAVELTRSVGEEALDRDGGLVYEGHAGKVIDPNREWWCQAEAVVGFWQAYSLTGEEVFAEAAEKVWSFIDRKMVDRTGGEWFWRIRADGSVDEGEPKVSEWKGPYHNTRMCLEMLERLGEEEQGKT